MRGGEATGSMGAGPRTILAACGLLWAIGAACGGGGGRSSFSLPDPFPQAFLPVVLAAGDDAGDVAFGASGNLYAVRGTASVVEVAKSDGSVGVFASGVGGSGTALRSIAGAGDGRLFVGDDGGRIFAIDAEGTATLLIDTGAPDPITGLAIAPTGFGELAGSLVAAAGDSGLLVVTTGSEPTASELAAPGARYVDVAFSGATLFALDATDAEIDTVTPTGEVASFQGGFTAPVGLAVDALHGEIWVADAGEAALLVVPVAGGAPVARAPYELAADAPSGIAFDGQGAAAWLTAGPVLRGAAVPRIDPANPNFGLIVAGPTVGYGDLELDRVGAFLLSANDADATPPSGNFLLSITRDGQFVTTLSSGIGAAGEDLLGLASDPVERLLYVGSRLGNVYRRASDGTVSLLVSASADAVLGLELAPAGFGAFGGHLVATTEAGLVLAIDPVSPTPPAPIAAISTASGAPARLSDLVFASDGTLYVLDHGNDTVSPADPGRVLVVTPAGGTSDLGVSPLALGRPDGLEIDEGGRRLLVATATAGGDLLVAVALDGPATVTPLASVSIDDGFFPTGVVYDRLGTAVVRSGDASTSLDAVAVFP